MTNQLSDGELRKRRKYDRERKQAYRKRLKIQKLEASDDTCERNSSGQFEVRALQNIDDGNDNSRNSDSDVEMDLDVHNDLSTSISSAHHESCNSISHQKVSGVKRAKGNQRQCYQKNIKLTAEVDSLKTALNTMSERFHRLKLKASKKSESES